MQPSVSGVAVSLLMSELTVNILSTFCGVFEVQYTKLMLRIFEFGVLLFDCFVYPQTVTYLKRFIRCGHYAGEVEYNRRQTRSCLLNRSARNYGV